MSKTLNLRAAKTRKRRARPILTEAMLNEAIAAAPIMTPITIRTMLSQSYLEDLFNPTETKP